jgi:2-C-methyl-D-erythritol 4-phosphate cytidylyltransferase
MKGSAWGVVVAGSKENGIPSEAYIPLLGLSGRPVIIHALLAFQSAPSIEGVVVVCRKDAMERLAGNIQIFGCGKVKKIVAGALSQRVSLQNGVDVLDEECAWITIHDAARPCLHADLIERTLQSARRHGCGIAAEPIQNPVKRVERGSQVVDSLDGGKLWIAQTPQSYKADLLRQALAAAQKARNDLSDESEAMALIKKPVHLVPSNSLNIRIQTADDLALATAVINLSGAR